MFEPMTPLSLTWLGHATFFIVSPAGKRILVDPWLATNPACPPSAKKIAALDLMLVTHGHDDHMADAISIARATGARVIAPHELSLWFTQKGLQQVTGMNLGGTLSALGLTITMVKAEHSSSVIDEGRPVYAGAASGFVVRFENDLRIYFAGDTAVFSDMRLIGELYRPSIAVLPIGNTLTMGPEEAAKACELLGVRQVIPMHYGTSPRLTGTPAQLRELVEPRGIEVLEQRAGEPAVFDAVTV